MGIRDRGGDDWCGVRVGVGVAGAGDVGLGMGFGRFVNIFRLESLAGWIADCDYYIVSSLRLSSAFSETCTSMRTPRVTVGLRG